MSAARRLLLLLPSSSSPQWHPHDAMRGWRRASSSSSSSPGRHRHAASPSSATGRCHHRIRRGFALANPHLPPPSPPNNASDDDDDESVVHDAIIVGGGPTGLLLSNLLSNYGIGSHLLFDVRPSSTVLSHPQAHYINVRSMEILRTELPNAYDGVLRDMPDVENWESFHFGGCVKGWGGRMGRRRRLGRVVHPVRGALRVGRGGDAILVGRNGKGRVETTTTTTTTTTTSTRDATNDDDGDDEEIASACRPAHLAQNKFASLLLREARRDRRLCLRRDDDSIARSDDDDDDEDDPDRGGGEGGGDDDRRIRYGEGVIDVSEEEPTPPSASSSSILAVRTTSGRTYRTRILLAADGARSSIREKYCGIRMIGDDRVQDLINVHFRTNGALSKFLMRRGGDGGGGRNNGDDDDDDDDEDEDDRGMLHFVYNPRLVGAFVCHDGDEGEWVLQVPYFPPYQTVEYDFDTGKIREMIWSGLLGEYDAGLVELDKDVDFFDFEVLSVRPWRMSCLVAERYVVSSGGGGSSSSHRGGGGNVVLVGDAAHAFPPAGGFGMNTGLQDAHNVAWRVALSLRMSSAAATTSSDDDDRDEDKEDEEEEDDGRRSALSVDEGRDFRASMPSSAPSLAGWSAAILARYDEERRPVAARNAALSMRNYRRTLRIAEACHLDARHPRLLASLLDSLPANMIPMEARRDAFRVLVRAAMSPLGGLLADSAAAGGDRLSSFHADRIEANVRRILESGGSLPLVFPRYELGFSYGPPGDGGDVDDDVDESNDAAGYVPRVKAGHRMPHVLVEAATRPEGDKIGRGVLGTRQNSTDDAYLSLTDISSELRRINPSPSPLFTLLAVGPAFAAYIPRANEIVICVTKRWQVPIILVHVLPERNHDDARFSDVVSVIDMRRALPNLLRREKATFRGVNGHGDNDEVVNALIMVRPDGHIANVAWINERESGEEILGQIRRAIEQGLENALGMSALGGSE